MKRRGNRRPDETLPKGSCSPGYPPDESQLPDDLCQFCYELADEMAVHNQSDVMTEYAEIHHHAHGAGNQ